MIVGRVGAGKSTLLNTLFGYNVAETGTRSDVTTEVSKYTLPRTGVEIYDTPGAGGLSSNAEVAMRQFLRLRAPPGEKEPLAADLVIFLFSYERVNRLDLEFFSEVDATYGPRVLVVKNYASHETTDDRLRNIEAIEARCGKRPLSVDAKMGTGIGDLIREILRLLPRQRLLAFNNSLDNHRQRAQDMAKAFTVKYAAQAAVASSEGTSEASARLTDLRNEMFRSISTAYIDDLEISHGRPPISLTEEGQAGNAMARAGLGSVAGGLIGLLGGPLGVLLGLFLGGLIGASTMPKRFRGGASAVTEFLSLGWCQSQLLDRALAEPTIALSRGEAQAKAWLRQHQHEFQGMVEDSRKDVAGAILSGSLVEALNSPNTRDPSDVELWLRPVADELFSSRALS